MTLPQAQPRAPRSQQRFCRALWLLACVGWLSGCAVLYSPLSAPLPSPPSTAAGRLPAAADIPSAADVPSVPSVAAAPVALRVTAVPLPAAEAEPAALPARQPEFTPPGQPPPRTRLDPYEDAARSDLWARVRQGFVLSNLEGELVGKWERWYSSRPDYVQRMTERGSRYLFHILEEVERRGMPSDLALLPFIESAFNPEAMSVARASGMWQFMPATGKDFELRQNLFRDDRRDVLASTRAALDYLTKLNKTFGDWHLALAAYNWGQGNVFKAIERNRRAGLGTGYADLVMPDETRNYVPKLQAVKNLVARPEAYAVVLPALENHPFFLSVAIERDIDLALAAQLAGLPLEDFKQLNPQMNKPVILAAGTPQVLLPYDNANRFLRSLAEHRGPLATWTAWVAPKTIKPADAARAVGMPEALLREVNRIPERMLVKAGSTLLVPRAAHSLHDVAGHVADSAAMALAPEPRPLRKVSFKAGKKGDSVAAVAQRYRVSPAQVASWNSVSPQAHFRAGQTVTLMLASAPPAMATAAKAGRPVARPAPKLRVAAR